MTGKKRVSRRVTKKKKPASKEVAKTVAQKDLAIYDFPRPVPLHMRRTIADALEKGRKSRKCNGYPTTHRQAIFGWYIAEFTDKTQSEAYRFAGFDASTDKRAAAEASRLRKKLTPYITDMLSARLKDITPSRAILDRELARVAFNDVVDFYEVIEETDEFGQVSYIHRPKPMSALTPAQRAVIKRTVIKDGRLINYEFHDKMDALDKLMQTMGLKSPEFIAAQVGTLIQNKEELHLDFSRIPIEELQSTVETLAKAAKIENKSGE